MFHTMRTWKNGKEEVNVRKHNFVRRNMNEMDVNDEITADIRECNRYAVPSSTGQGQEKEYSGI
jgi:hypothetical protein